MGKQTKKDGPNRDEYTVVLEDIRSQNRTIAEVVTGINDKLDSHMVDFENLKANVELIKGELAVIRHNQVTRDEFKLLEVRVARLEQMK